MSQARLEEENTELLVQMNEERRRVAELEALLAQEHRLKEVYRLLAPFRPPVLPSPPPPAPQEFAKESFDQLSSSLTALQAQATVAITRAQETTSDLQRVRVPPLPPPL